MELLVAVVAVVVLAATYVTWTAGRIDRLHARLDAAYSALDAQLVRRAVAAEALPRGIAGVEIERLRMLARTARAAGPDQRELAENDLSRALRALAADPADPGLTELVLASTRVGFARQFYNDAVRDTRALRRRRVPRLLRLGAGRPLPDYFEIDEVGVAGGRPLAGRAEDTGGGTTMGEAPTLPEKGL